jgi:hypothetical protein
MRKNEKNIFGFFILGFLSLSLANVWSHEVKKSTHVLSIKTALFFGQFRKCFEFKNLKTGRF